MKTTEHEMGNWAYMYMQDLYCRGLSGYAYPYEAYIRYHVSYLCLILQRNPGPSSW